MKIQVCFALLCVCVGGALAFTCSSCDLSSCPDVNCRFGVTRDECDCCATCYKGIGETCGGRYNQFGRCASRLSCVYIPQPGEPTRDPFDHNQGGRCFALP